MKRIFSGVQPSGNLHIGNYLGAVKNWVKLQNDFDSIFCVVDLHAITVPQDPKELRKKTLEIAKIYLAAGVNPERSTIFVQSHVPAHAELTWILNTIVKVSELERMTQYKDKAKKGGAGAGLFDYPVLMAADILLYDTDFVPVGHDQLQHIELTRTLAKRFNSLYGEIFVLPQPYVGKESMRIMGLDNPLKKMSKSASSEYNYIGLLDEPELIRKKIMKAVTDSGKEIVYHESKPALKNLINIFSAFSGKNPREIEKNYKGKGYAEFKSDLADLICEEMKVLQKRYYEISDNEILEILRNGASRAEIIASRKVSMIKEKIGLLKK